MTNLLQNYIASKTVVQPIQKPKPDFDIQRELDNRTFIKPMHGKGRLISGNPFSSPRYMFDDFVYSIKAFKHAAKGDANDHELGKLNDVGLMGGGLAIASYLTTKRYTPMTKGMEFVGLGSFLASMMLWPKIAIQLPAYLIHGVNVGKEYKDSFGRKKHFYQDPQFIPWDLYSDKQIDKIGDRLGVPKNIPNRRDFIQERMRKLAVQNNTLWMLTAGFATPVMSALICNLTEPHLKNHLNNVTNKKADSILKDVDKYSKKYESDLIQKKLKAITGLYSGKPVTEELLEEITNVFTENLDSISSESFKKDLQEIMLNGEYSITESTAKTLARNIQKHFKNNNFTKEFIDTVLPSEDKMVQLFREKNLSGNMKPEEFQKIKFELSKYITTNLNAFNSNHPNDFQDIKFVRNTLFGFNFDKNPVHKTLHEVKASIFDEVLQKRLFETAEIFDKFRVKNWALDEYALLKVGAAPETVIANYWNNVSNDLLKTLGISQKEIEKVRFNRNLMGNLLRDKIENIVSDKASFEKVMKELVEKVASLDSQIKSSDITSHMLKGDNTERAKTAYETAVDNTFDEASNAMRSKGFSRTAEAISGRDGNIQGSYKNIQKAFVEERLLGVKSSFNRLINTLDFFRRVATDPNKLKPYNIIPREVKEELIELCKIVSLEGHSSDHATKFYMLRNPNPADDYSPIDVKNGKVKYKYFGSSQNGLTDIPEDKYFYQNAMHFMYGEDLHPETKAILENSIVKDEVSNYRKLVFEKLGGDRYFTKPYHLVSSPVGTGSDIKFLITGIAPDELFFKVGQQAFNTKKWFKMFGGFGAGLLGLTIFAQFFLGKIKAPRQVKHD